MKLLEKLASREQPITLHFIRHGQSDGNALGRNCPVNNDFSLTEQGVREAHSIAEYFKAQGITVTDVYTSPLERATQTAGIIADSFGVHPVVQDDLRERNWGEFGEMVWDELAEKLDGMSQEERYSFTPEGGESWQHMEERVLKSIENIVDENDAGEHVVIITHRGVLRATLPVLDKAALEQHKDYSVPTGSITSFQFDTQGIDLLGLLPNEE